MTDLTGLDPSTPVLVGVGQSSDPLDSPHYHRWSAVELAAAAAREALADAGVEAGEIDTVAGVRQFEVSTPYAQAPLGRSDSFPRSVAGRLGAEPRRAILEVTGGQSPQHLVAELARAIAAGEAGTVLLVGAEAISTARAWAGKPDAPDFGETVGGQLEDRGYGLDGMLTGLELAHGLVAPPTYYALFENARRHRLGLSRAEYAEAIGRLFEPFTEVAAANPHAAAPVRRTAAELMEVTDRNRLITDPYPRYVVARDQVNQGAAVLLTSVGRAAAYGVPRERWVFLHGASDLVERPVLDRPDLGLSPASVRAAATALERAGTTPDELDAIDLYSCFAVPVFLVCDGLGIAYDDPRGLTRTGGLPFFGGPGNNYSMHAIAEVVAAVRARPGSRGLVGANGGFCSKYSAGVYSTEPVPFRAWSDAGLQADLDRVPGPGVTEAYAGPATIETCTVAPRRDGSAYAVVVARLPDGTRTLAVAADGDDDVVAALLGEQPIGSGVELRRTGEVNTVARVLG